MNKRNPFLYYGKKLLIFLLSVIILSMAVFCISRIAPGDPLMSYYGDRVEKMTEEEKDLAREKLGLNDPLHIQYLRWAENALKGDFGISYKYKEDVTEVISQRIGNTLILGGIGFLLTFLGALALGIPLFTGLSTLLPIHFTPAMLMAPPTYPGMLLMRFWGP